MHPLTKLYLLLSSVLVFSSCRISKYNHSNYDKVNLKQDAFIPVLKPNNVLKYNTTIDILKNHLTGLLIIKQTDSTTKHIIFVTELGMKMFDFEVKNNTINTNYVFEPINKPQLIEAFKTNFSNMLLLDSYKDNDLKFELPNGVVFISKKGNDKKCYTVSKTNGLTLQETFHNKKRTSKITYIYNKNTQSYSQIKCKQYGLIKFYFELNEIPKTND